MAGEMTFASPRVFVVHALLDVQVDAADGVNDARECARVDDEVVIHRHAEELLHGLHA